MSSLRSNSKYSLRHISVFQGLTAQELGHVESFPRLLRIQSNGSLLTTDEVDDFVYFIVTGTVCIYRIQKGGSRLIFNIVGPGEMLGELSALDGRGHSACAVATEPAEVLRMRLSDFCALEAMLPQLSRNIKNLLTARLRFATTHNETLAARAVHLRLTRLLAALGERYSQSSAEAKITIPLRLTQNEIFDWICVSRQHGSVHFQQLCAEKIVQVLPRRRIAILDRPRLLQHCS